MAKDHGPQIKDDERYEALRKQGAEQGKGSADRQHQPQQSGQARRQVASLRGLEQGVISTSAPRRSASRDAPG